MLYYGAWGSGRSWSNDYFLSRMANVALMAARENADCF